MLTAKHNEGGVALFLSLIILLLLSALAVGFVYMASTDTIVSANYRNQQTLYFAAKAGMEEARGRLMTTVGTTNVVNPNSIVSPSCAGGANACLPAVPVVPNDANHGVLYILGGPNPAAVTPWVAGTIYTDDELCHNGYSLTGLNPHSADVHCPDVPTTANWYSATNSIAPWNSTSAALPFLWARVSLKLNGSVDSGKYKVNPALPVNAPVCWDGTREIVANAPTCAGTPSAANPVYLITAMAANTQSGSRRFVQSEVALTPTPPFPYGMFATGNTCSALQLGGGATTDSYTSANGSNYANSHTNTGGDVGSNGNVGLNGSSTQIGGSIGVPNATTGACPAGLTIAGGAGFLPPTTSNTLVAAGPFTFPTPPSPVPLPPNTNEPKIGKTGATLLPGTYGNISVTAGGTITIAPGTYNINSISLSGNSNLVISPSGTVVFNVAGTGQNTPIDFSGGSITNNSLVANTFMINYGGTGNVSLSGNTATYLTLNAPNADVNITGGSDIYGAIIGRTIKNMGGTKFHYDKNTSLGPPSVGYYTLIALRDVQF